MSETTKLELAVAEAEAAIRSAADEKVEQVRGYRDHLLAGGDPNAWRFPYAGSDAGKAITNAWRADAGLPASPYLPGTDEYVVFDAMLAAGDAGMIGTEALAAIKASPARSYRRTVSVYTLLRSGVLRRAGFDLVKMGGTPVRYRMVKLLGEAVPEGGADDAA